jgi:hypothetical protein
LAANIAAPPNNAAAPTAPVGIAAAPEELELVALLAALAALELTLEIALLVLLLSELLKLLATLLALLASEPVTVLRTEEMED